MPRRHPKDIIPEWNPELANPHRSYWVYAHNAKLEGDVGGQRFQAGKCRLDAVPKANPACNPRFEGTDENGDGIYVYCICPAAGNKAADIAADRIDLLTLMMNTHRTEVPIQVYSEEKRTMIQEGSRMVDTYRIEPSEGPEPTRETARDRARAAEKALNESEDDSPRAQRRRTAELVTA